MLKQIIRKPSENGLGGSSVSSHIAPVSIDKSAAYGRQVTQSGNSVTQQSYTMRQVQIRRLQLHRDEDDRSVQSNPSLPPNSSAAATTANTTLPPPTLSLQRPVEDAKPGSYSISYRGGAKQEVQTNKEQALSSGQPSPAVSLPLPQYTPQPTPQYTPHSTPYHATAVEAYHHDTSSECDRSALHVTAVHVLEEDSSSQEHSYYHSVQAAGNAIASHGGYAQYADYRYSQGGHHIDQEGYRGDHRALRDDHLGHGEYVGQGYHAEGEEGESEEEEY